MRIPSDTTKSRDVGSTSPVPPPSRSRSKQVRHVQASSRGGTDRSRRSAVEEMDIDNGGGGSGSGSGCTTSSSEANPAIAQVEEAATNLTSVLNRYIGHDGDDDDDDNGDEQWADNPLGVFEEIQRARDMLSAACRKYDEDNKSVAHSSSGDGGADVPSRVDEDEFRTLYVDTITTAFASELDDIRTGKVRTVAKSSKSGKKRKKNAGGDKSSKGKEDAEEENIFVEPDHATEQVAANIDVNILVDLIQAGMSSFTQEERAMLIEESNKKKHERENEDSDNNNEDDIGLTPHEQRRRRLWSISYLSVEPK